MTKTHRPVIYVVAGLLGGMLLAHNPLTHHDPRVIVRTKTEVKVVKVPQPYPVPTQVPVPGPTVTVTVTSDACARLGGAIDSLIAKMEASSKVGSEFLPVLDDAAKQIADHNIDGITADVMKARDIKDRLGTANIEELQLVDDLSNALNTCRQESNK